MSTGRTPQDYETEIAALKAEIERLHRAGRVALTGTLAVSSLSREGHTVMGIEEMILQLNPDDTVGYVNTPMAVLLGMPDRKGVIGDALSKWDRAPLGEGVLAALAEVSRGGEAAHVLERACPGLPPDRLPDPSAERPAGDPVLRFTATCIKGRVHIVAQDVTRLRWLEQTFSRFVSPAVIDKMRTMSATTFLSMERRELTVLFADLRGFTGLSQSLAPEQVQEVVNSFLCNMVACVDRLEGTVDKFVGDEVMAIFGAPLAMPDHALRALICACEMQHAHAEWIASRDAAGTPALPMGIGVATGPVVVGNVGTPTRMDYTALGHTVNLAARLCGSAEGGETLTIPATHGAAMGSLQVYAGAVAVPRMSFKSKGKMIFKNVAEPIEVVAMTAGTKKDSLPPKSS